VADDLVHLTVPLGDLQAAFDEAQLRHHVIETSLSRRIHATYIVAIETQVEEIAAQLGALKAEVDAIHRTANQPDPIVTAVLAVIDLLKLPDPAPPAPTVRWPKWSSVGSKHAKSQWVGDMFAVPELKPPPESA